MNVEAQDGEDSASIQFKQQALASSRVIPGEETRTNIAVNCSAPFGGAAPLSLEVVFACAGTNYRLPLLLPVAVCAFFAPHSIADKAAYMERWKAIAGEGTEQQSVFASARPVNAALMTHLKTVLLPSMHLAMAEGLDSEKTATCSGDFQMSGGSAPVPVLMRLESDAVQQKFRVTVRAGQAKVAVALKSLIVDLLSQ